MRHFVPITLLAMVIATTTHLHAAVHGWRGDGTGCHPGPTPPIKWDGKQDTGVAWGVPMPAMSHAIPLVMAGRVFVTSEPYDLICIDLATGEKAWTMSNSQFELMAEDEAAAGRALLAEERELVAANRAWAKQVADLKNALKKAGEKDIAKGASWRGAFDHSAGPGDELPADAELAERWRELATQAVKPGFSYDRVGSNLNREQHDGNRERAWKLAQDYAEWYESRSRGWHRVTGRCFASPVGDGEAVYVSYANNVVASYALDGTLRWHVWDHRPRPGKGKDLSEIRRELYFAASPVVVGDLLVVVADKGRIRAYARSDGSKRWEGAYPDRGKNVVGTPARLTVGGTEVLVGANGHVYRAADGVVLADDLPPCGGGASPLAADGLVYMLVRGKSKSEHKGLVAVELAADGSDAMSWQVRWQVPDVGDTSRMPALHDGLLYHTKDKKLAVYAAKDGAVIHQGSKKLPQRYTAYSVFGDRLYTKGTGDEVQVYSLGREPELAGKNRLKIDKSDRNYSQPAAADGRLVIRSHGTLICIGE